MSRRAPRAILSLHAKYARPRGRVAIHCLVTLLAIALACGGSTTGPGTSAPSRAQLFDEVWSDVDAHYAFFQLGNIDGSIDGLVIDIRGNLGGDETNAQGVAADVTAARRRIVTQLAKR